MGSGCSGARGTFISGTRLCAPPLVGPGPSLRPSGRGWGALTEVGELHSLTDWQVSEASEDAELEDFCHAEAGGQAGRRAGEERTDLVTGPACSGRSDNSTRPAPPRPGPRLSAPAGEQRPSAHHQL